MPIWLPIALQVLQAILGVVVQHQPTLEGAELDAHNEVVTKIKAAIDCLK